MPVAKAKNVSVKLLKADFAKLREHARRKSIKPSSAGSAMIAQGLRMIAHPAIEFQETPDGSACARLAGRRVAVWLVVETLNQCEGDKRTAARALNLPMTLFLAALRYAAEYGEEIQADARRGKRTLLECRLRLGPTEK